MFGFGYYEPIVIVTLLNVILTLGLYITALSGQLSMATAAIAGVAGYTSAILTVKFGLPFWVGLLAGMLASSLVGAFLATITIRMRDFLLKLTTLAFGEALSVLAFNWDYIGGANSFSGLELDTTLPLCIAATAVALYVAWRVDGSQLGFAARAVRDDPLAAIAMGVSLPRVRILTFAIGSVLVGLGGVLQAHYVLLVTPSDLGFFVSINYIIFLLFGGLQTMWGALLGAAILTALPEMLRFAANYRLIIYGLLIILVVLLRPEGLLTRRPTGPRPNSRAERRADGTSPKGENNGNTKDFTAHNEPQKL